MPPGVNRNTQARALHQRHWLLTAGKIETGQRHLENKCSNTPRPTQHGPRSRPSSRLRCCPPCPPRCQHQGHRRKNPLLDKLTATPWASATNWPCLRAQGSSREGLYTAALGQSPGKFYRGPVHRGPGSEPREALERACTPWPRVRAQGSSREGLYTVAPGQSPGKL